MTVPSALIGAEQLNYCSFLFSFVARIIGNTRQGDACCAVGAVASSACALIAQLPPTCVPLKPIPGSHSVGIRCRHPPNAFSSVGLRAGMPAASPRARWRPRQPWRGSSQRVDQMNEQMQTRTTYVRGQPVVIHSFDGQRWFSDAHEARQCEKRREKFLAERAKSLKRSATFQHSGDRC